MCGRYASTKDPAQLALEFSAVDATASEAPGADYNIAPTKPVLAIVARHPRDADGRPDPSAVERTIRVMRWGLVPTWSQDRNVGVKMINARSETAAVKPAYSESMARRRCILPADGWFEWRRETGAKEPFYVTNPDDTSLAMAGLWTAWRDPNQPASPWLVTCAVLTTDAFGPLASVHERMPLVLPRDAYERWLAPDLGSDDVADLLKPSPEIVDRYELRRVSTAVNSIRNNGPELLAEAEPEPVELDLFS
ncbi:SOS response-associated peptidase [Kutzneria buriramensis]|uniref:Abasic site processing protein n=1 Tax=Kutzneria buriramensis TaxID=1045776 RepID=A0A3E0IAU7_9PSEU|nr:SOS response-associated peptidase [Kutzneria buriramensis]REH55842.1 putative SOS response-associated peptidase YedK [Kutzneria buriramensis]